MKFKMESNLKELMQSNDKKWVVDIILAYKSNGSWFLKNLVR